MRQRILTWSKWAAPVVALATIGVVLAACGGSGSSGTNVKVSEKEWSIAPDVAEVKQGKVTFNVSNDGTRPHEFIVVQTDLAPDALPTGSDGSVNEDAIKKVVDLDPFGANTSKTPSVNLKPGKYVMICNISETLPVQLNHYQQGMRVAFTVTP